MDVDQARTFLAVIYAGSFVGAASKVFVTQSTVSMRIKTLEEQLGKRLFERSKAGATLTPDGLRFQKHALGMVRLWEHARLEISLPEGYQAALAVGAQYSLWDGFLLDWLHKMRTNAAEVAIKTELGYSSTLMQHLVDGTLDLGVMYTPQARPGFEVELLFEDELVLVSGKRMSDWTPDRDYIYVDWGPEFQADHSLNFPTLSTPGLYMELGSLSLKYILKHAAAGYFPRRLVSEYLASERLHLVPKAPVFSYPAYVAYSSYADELILEQALPALRAIAGEQIQV